MSEVVYVMISVAAERAGMHPQTLRVYEARGLIRPHRSGGNTRLYSQHDILRLQRIQELSGAGVNLAGIERILELEEALARRSAETAKLGDFARRATTEIKQLRHQLADAARLLDELGDGRRGSARA